jgi:uncharacterized protein DUF4339
MELNYMVRGADGKPYGPATLEQLGGWVREGRLPAGAEVRRSDMEHWAPAADFVELQPLFDSPAGGVAVEVRAPAATVQKDPATLAQLKSSASWFYWIAALSLINSVSAFGGLGFRFIVGLGITQVFDSVGAGLSRGGNVVALGLDLLAAGVFVLFGFFAHKAQTWAFLAGMVLFALDGALLFVAQDWIGVAFHAFVLYMLFRGFKVCRALRA